MRAGELPSSYSPHHKFLAVLISIGAACLIPNAMLTGRGPADDRDVFAYIGWLMHRGFVPYRDVWDHKGPLLYAVNWLGWALTPHTTVGIGILQLTVYAVSFWLLARIAARLAGDGVFVVVAFAAIAFLAQTGEGGNMAETWAVLPIAITHAIVFESFASRWRFWFAPVLGFCIAATLLIRPNLAAEPLLGAVFLTLLPQCRRPSVPAFTVLSVSLGCVAAILPIWSAGALPDFIAAYWTYNAAYSRLTTLRQHFAGLMQLLFVMRTAALFYAGAIGWVLLCRSARHRNELRAWLPDGYRLFLLLALPAEVACAALSGRPFYHYLVPLFPVLSILSVIALSCLMHLLRPAGTSLRLTVLVIGGLVAVLQLRKYILFAGMAFRVAQPEGQVAAFLQQATAATDRVLPIGDIGSMQVALKSRRLPVSKYVYQLPLIHRANAGAGQQRAELLHDLQIGKPAAVFSLPGPGGSLCGAPDPEESWNRAVALRDGYARGQIRDLLAPELQFHYRQIERADFQSACVFLRADLAH